MEKEYSLGEALEMLNKNRDLIFKIKPAYDQAEDCTQRISSNIAGAILVGCNGCDCSENCNISLNDKWELVQQPVSFIEAVKAYREKKTIYCVLKNGEYTYRPNSDSELETMYDTLGDGLSSTEILDGKWYIKED